MDAVIENLPLLWGGFLRTLALLGIAGVGALIIGTFVAGMRLSPVAPMRTVATVYTEAAAQHPAHARAARIRGRHPEPRTAPRGVDSQTQFFILAAIGLTLYTSPFIAEAIRSGVNSIPVGQAEAARSIGLGFGQTLSSVILPQAIRMVIPPIINVLIALTKNTSVARRLLRRRADRRVPRGDQRPRRRGHRHPALGRRVLPGGHDHARPHRRRTSRSAWRCCDEHRPLRRPRPEGPPHAPASSASSSPSSSSRRWPG